MNHNRWIAVIAALLFAAAVGFMAYNAGTAHGIAQSGKIVAPQPGPGPYPYPYYGWHPWGFGFVFAPFFFFLFFIFLMRAIFWGGAHRHMCGYRHHHEQPEGGAPQQ